MNIGNLPGNKDLRFLGLVILEVLICVVVGSLVISVINGKSLRETWFQGTVIAVILVPAYNYLNPQSGSS